ncbi:hypothetical protein GQ457_06G029880 [Hibiscus cannabinus]
MATPSYMSAFLLLLVVLEFITVMGVTFPQCRPIVADDRDQIQFALNLEFLEADFFLLGALGKGLDGFDSSLARGGPPPVGGRIADLEPTVRRIIGEFGYQEIGHIRFRFPSLCGGFCHNNEPSTGYHTLSSIRSLRQLPQLSPGILGYLVASLLGVAVIRALLYERADETVRPYGLTVANFTNLQLGAENRTTSNILSADVDSISYSRTPPEILRIVYGSGSERRPGGFFPTGGSGRIAMLLLH